MNKIKSVINNKEFVFLTDENVFSPQSIDKGTLAMLSQLELKSEDKVLDIGCGYGVVGVYCANIVGAHRVYMFDVDTRAVELSKINMELNGFYAENVIVSNGFKEITWKGFDIILSNPPYHENFSIPKEFIEKGFNRLNIGGKMYMVTKRKEWYKKKLIAIFGGVKIWELDGYFVFMAVKKSDRYAGKKYEKLKNEQKKQSKSI